MIQRHFEPARRLAQLFQQTFWLTLRPQSARDQGVVLRQCFEIGNRSLFFVLVTLGFIAMVTTFQICLQLNRVTGDLSRVGPEYLKLLIHETAPTITALMLATRVGAGIAAEIGSMVATEQIDALRMNGIDPVEYLIVPRFLASLLMTPMLTICAAAASLGCSTATAYYAFEVNSRVFIDFSAITFSDIATGLVKSLTYGAVIPILSGYCGLTTKGGSEGVGSATTRAVIQSSLVVLILDFFISALSFAIFHPMQSA